MDIYQTPESFGYIVESLVFSPRSSDKTYYVVVSTPITNPMSPDLRQDLVKYFKANLNGDYSVNFQNGEVQAGWDTAVTAFLSCEGRHYGISVNNFPNKTVLTEIFDKKLETNRVKVVSLVRTVNGSRRIVNIMFYSDATEADLSGIVMAIPDLRSSGADRMSNEYLASLIDIYLPENTELVDIRVVRERTKVKELNE